MAVATTSMPLDRWALPDILLVPGADLQAYFDTIKTIKLPTAEQEAAWGRAARQGDRAAQIRLAQGGLRFAAHLARQHYAATPHPTDGEGVWSLADAVQAANIGLWIAAQRFDPDQARFSTYAATWIRQSLDRLRGQFLYAIRLPAHAEAEWIAYRRAVEQWHRHQSAPPTPEDLAPWLPWPHSKIAFWHQWAETMAEPLSLDALGDFLSDRTTDPTTTLHALWVHEVIDQLWAILNLQEQRVLRLRYGFYGAPMTLQEIGELLQISRERVRRIEARALKKLRTYVAQHPDQFGN